MGIYQSNPSFDSNYEKARIQYERYIRKVKNGSWTSAYSRVFKKDTKNEIVKSFEGVQSVMSSRSYLREYVEARAVSPEALLKFRQTFARSLACLNICSYILGKFFKLNVSYSKGIGDRHLENFLVDSSKYNLKFISI